MDRTHLTVSRLVLASIGVAGAFGTAGTAFAGVVDVEPVPEGLRAHPTVPEPHRDTQSVTLKKSSLAPARGPDYGTPAPSKAVTAELNTDARITGTEIQTQINELEPKADEQQERNELDDCFKGALFSILLDAIWDSANNRSVNLLSELTATSNRAASCIADHFHVGYLTAASISDWMLESVVHNGVDVLAHDPYVSAFIDWTAVTAWYSIPPAGQA